MTSELFAHHSWATGRVLDLCDGLSDAQLDQTRLMGFGSLRATLFHILAAERLWMDRWQGRPWAPLETDSAGIPLAELRKGFREAADERDALLRNEEASDFSRVVTYRNTAGNEFSHPLGELLVHVANHGIHHRAQALNFLRLLGRTVPGGLDYLFFKLACPTVAQEPATVEHFRARGLEMDSGSGNRQRFEKSRIGRYFASSDWAVSQVLAAANGTDDELLDRPFEMGLGSIRSTLLHLYDAECWWQRNWTSSDPVDFEKLPPTTPLDRLKGLWDELARARNAFIAALDDEQAQRVVSVRLGRSPVRFRVIESLLQLCGHGTHHRAQVLNMLRQIGITPPALDYSVWLRAPY
jgi:uncharacterized damage-inducible protein DinB